MNRKEIDYLVEKFTTDEIFKYIISKNDIGYIRSGILYREKLGFGSSYVVKLILATHDVEYIKKCIKNRKGLRLAPFHYLKLIIGTNDIDYIKKCIKNRKRLGLCSHYVSQLILATNDNKFIDKCINNGVKMGLDSYVITQLIFNKNDDIEYYKNCICNWKKLGLKGSDISFLIKNINDIQYTKECISKYTKVLNSDNITYLILNSSDNKFKIECINNSKKYNLKSKDLLKILMTGNDINFIKKNIDTAINNGLTKTDLDYLHAFIDRKITKYSQKYISSIIPKNMTFGIEIESVGFYIDKFNSISINSHNWNITKDDTIQENVNGQYGREIISPVLELHDSKQLCEIKYVIELLRKIGQSVNDSCGGHIHIGFDYIDNNKELLNLIELWALNP